jgi:hypothetical protein
MNSEDARGRDSARQPVKATVAGEFSPKASRGVRVRRTAYLSAQVDDWER